MAVGIRLGNSNGAGDRALRSLGLHRQKRVAGAAMAHQSNGGVPNELVPEIVITLKRSVIFEERFLMKFSSLVSLTSLSFLIASTLSPGAGWRTDGSGLYPDADPVVEWSTEDNVIYKTPLPDWGNSSPVLEGDKIFLNTEPDTLVCLGAEDGEILWKAASPLASAMSAEEQEQLEKNKVAIEEMEQEVMKLNREIRQVQRQLRRAEGEEKEAIGAKRDQMLERRDELTKNLTNMGGILTPQTHPSNGYTSPTPVTDGERVYAVYGTGVIAAFDMEGNRLWTVLHEQPDHNWGHSSSPLLVDGKLMVHIKDLMALDPETGEVIWETEIEEGWGTAAVDQVGETTILVTSKGDIVRAEDGEVLASDLFDLPYGSPIIHEGVIYAVDQNGGVAFQLGDQVESDQIAVTKLWENDPPRDRYYSSPVVVDGVLYAMNRGREFSAIDAKTGEILYSEKIDMGRGQQLYGSLSLAGGKLFVNHDSGSTAVLKPGGEFELVKVNALEPTRSTPIFDEGRIYFRTDSHLFCLGLP